MLFEIFSFSFIKPKVKLLHRKTQKVILEPGFSANKHTEQTPTQEGAVIQIYNLKTGRETTATTMLPWRLCLFFFNGMKMSFSNKNLKYIWLKKIAVEG